jgi:hypothetical protein
MTLVAEASVFVDNPVIRHLYTADPAEPSMKWFLFQAAIRNSAGTIL